MVLSRRRLALWLSVPVLAAATAQAAQLDDASLAGWKPVVTLWGGDVGGAVKTLDSITHALSAAIHKYEIDKPTQKFIDGVLNELHDFDLNGLYKLLPDQRNGGRELNVKGALSGDRYLIERATPGSPYFVTMTGPRSNLADLSVFVHAEQHDGEDHDSLLIGGSAGLGIGPLNYRSLVEAQRELTRLVTIGHPTAGGPALPKSGLARAAVSEMNPGLGEEDLDALALLFDAYPTLGRALTNLGRVEDVRAATSDGDYFHITTRLKAEPNRMKKKYPALAKHTKNLSDILNAKIRVLDEKGRDIARIAVDSEKLTAQLEVYVQDGLLLPFDDQQVYASDPLDPLAEGKKKFSVLVNARVNMLGIVVTAKNMRSDVDYEPHDSYASVDARLNTVPKLKVEGRALGLFAPGFLDIFIPGNIQSITEEFFRVIAKGNDGKGAHGGGALGAKTAGAPGAISGSGSVEIMDTFLVKLAGGMVAKRLVIDDKVKNEGIQLASDLHDAFKVDLASFKKRIAQ